MEKTITVRGTASMDTAPDTVCFSIHTEVRDVDYEICLNAAQVHVERLTEAVQNGGFAADALRTAGMYINRIYDSVEDPPGHYRQAFSCYSVTHDLTLRFPMDTELIGRAYAAVSDCGSVSGCNVSYEVSDPEALRAELLEACARDARARAEVLCAASGVRLGELLHISYHFQDEVPQVFYGTCDGAPNLLRGMAKVQASPEDIHLTDSAEFKWALA